MVVEKPFGHDLASARALAAEIHQYIDESQLYRIDHFLGKMGTDEFLYLRFGNTMIEPVWNRNHIALRADHDGRELRRRGPRALLRSGRRAARRRRQPPDAGRRRGRDGGARGQRRATRSRTPSTPCSAPPTDADPAHYVRGQYDGYLDIDGVAKDSTTETYAALRLEIDNWRWSGVPWFIRTGKRLPVTQTELRAVFRHPPRLGFMEHGHRRPEPDQLVVKLDPTTGTQADPRRPPRRRRRAAGDHARHGVRRGGRRGADAVRGAAAGRDARRQHPLHPPGQRRRDVAHLRTAARTRPRPSTPTRPAPGARRRRSALVAGYGAWHGPWVAT